MSTYRSEDRRREAAVENDATEEFEIDFDSDEPIQRQACNLDGEGECEACQ